MDPQGLGKVDLPCSTPSNRATATDTGSVTAAKPRAWASLGQPAAHQRWFLRRHPQSPAALQLLTLAAYLAPEPIPLTLFTTHPNQLPDPLATAAADPLAFTALTPLLRRTRAGPRRARRPGAASLLAAILRTQPHQQQDLPSLAVRLLRGAVPADGPWDNPPAWPAWRQLLPHVLVATDPHRNLMGVEQDVAWLLDRAARYLHTWGKSLPLGRCPNEPAPAPLHARRRPPRHLGISRQSLLHLVGRWGSTVKPVSSAKTPSPACVGF